MPVFHGNPPFVGLDGWLRYQIEVLRAENWDVGGTGTILNAQDFTAAGRQKVEPDLSPDGERSEAGDGADH